MMSDASTDSLMWNDAPPEEANPERAVTTPAAAEGGPSVAGADSGKAWDSSMLAEPAAQTGVADAPQAASPQPAAPQSATGLAPTPTLPMTPVQALTTPLARTAGAATAPQPDKAGGLSVFSRADARHGFRIGDLLLTIRYEDSSELSEIAHIHRLPNSPPWFLGVTNLHGKLTPVFDLAEFMGISHGKQNKKQMLLVLAHGPDATGIIIDGLLERLRLPEDETTNTDAAPERLGSHLRSASMIDGQVWYDLDVRSLLGELEQSLAA
jgi:twitching motility protein PilI